MVKGRELQVSGIVWITYLPIGFLAGFCCGLAGLGAAVGFPIGIPFLGSFEFDWFTVAPPL